MARAPLHSPLPRRPLNGMALTLAAGTAIGLAWADLPAMVLTACGVLGLAAWAHRQAARSRRRQRTATALLHAALLATAAAGAALSIARRDAAERPLLALLDSPGTVALQGYVASAPTGQSLAHGGARLRFLFRAQAPGGTTGPPSVIWVDWYGPRAMLGDSPASPNPRVGQGWRLEGRLRELPRRRPTAPAVGFSVRPGGTTHRPEADAPRWIGALSSLQAAAGRRLRVGIGDSEVGSAVLRAMLLGDRADLTPTLRRTFARSGTVHIFAISGLHVGLLAALTVYILPMTRIPRPHWVWFLAPLLIGYTLLTGARPSAQRACTMALLFFGAPLIGRRPDALSALSAAAALLLLLQPLQLTDLGFVFSFVCVLGILLLAGPLIERRRARPDDATTGSSDRLWHAALLAVQGAPEPDCGHRWWQVLQTRLVAMLALSTATWLVSAPLTATYFGRVVPAAILSNLFAIPLAFGIVLCGILSLVSGLFWALPAAVFNSAALVLIEVLLAGTRFVARLPGASFSTGNWPPWLSVLWYIGCMALAVWLRLPSGAPSRGERIEPHRPRRPA